MNKKTDSRKKKAAKRRRRKMILNRIAIILFLLTLIGAVGFGIFKLISSVFAIKNIYAQNTVYYDKEDIIQASGINNGDNLLFLNTSDIEFKIYKKLPYISSSKVIKLFPDKIKIETKTSSPMYAICHENVYFFFDSNHKFLENKEQMIPEIPVVKGINFSVSEDDSKAIYEDSELEEIILIVINAFKNNLLSLEEIDLSDKNNIIALYDNRIKIILGSKEDIDYKVLTAHELISGKIGSEEKGSLDLSKLKENNKSYFTPEK